MRSNGRNTRTVFAAALALALPRLAGAQNPVTDWNAIAVSTALSSTVAPGSTTAGGTGLYLAYVHLAVYDAVNAIDQRFESYGPDIPANPGASVQAAAIAASYFTLLNYFPDRAATLTPQYTAALGTIPDGPAKSNGLQVGQAAANQMIAMRAFDGRGGAVPYSYPAGPVAGVWIPTPPSFALPQTPWVGQMMPFTMSGASQFLPDEAPPNLATLQWADDYNQVKTLGDVNSIARTPEQTDIALFWTEHTTNQYARALRVIAADRRLDVPETARLFAMAWTGYADAFIGCMNAKYRFSFWRPVTAIRNGEIDGNSATVADAAWTPLAITPNHPEYPAAHGCVTGAIAETLKTFFGTPNVRFVVTSTVPAVQDKVHSFASIHDLEREVEHARIYAGLHYHHSLVHGFVLGHRVVNNLSVRYFRPRNGAKR